MKREFRWTAMLALAAALGLPAVSGAAPDAADRAAVRQAVLDYVEGVYKRDPSRIERSVHPEPSKLGFYRPEPGAAYQGPRRMSYEALLRTAENFNRDGRIPADAPKEVILHEVLDRTATAKLVAWWGIDYMQLAKVDGRWLIVNVLWQSHPPR